MSKELKEKAAFYISLVLSPYIVGFVFALVSSVYFAQSLLQFLLWFPVQITFTTLIPLAATFALLRSGRITDIHVHRKEERRVFLLVALPILPVYLVSLAYVGAPAGLLLIVSGYSITAITVALFTLRTKVSAHSAAITACVAGFLILLRPYAIPAMGLVPMVVWARLHRGRHTLGQALMGVVLAFSVMLIVFVIYQVRGL